MDGQHKKNSSATLDGVLRIGLGNIPASAPLVRILGKGWARYQSALALVEIFISIS
jgi:hypothetical protein